MQLWNINFFLIVDICALKHNRENYLNNIYESNTTCLFYDVHLMIFVRYYLQTLFDKSYTRCLHLGWDVLNVYTHICIHTSLTFPLLSYIWNMYEGMILWYGRHLINCLAVVFVPPREFFIFDPSVTNISLFYSFYLLIYRSVQALENYRYYYIYFSLEFDIKVRTTIVPHYTLWL